MLYSNHREGQYDKAPKNFKLLVHTNSKEKGYRHMRKITTKRTIRNYQAKDVSNLTFLQFKNLSHKKYMDVVYYSRNAEKITGVVFLMDGIVYKAIDTKIVAMVL